MHTYIHTCVHTYTHSYIHTYTYIHACMHTYIHTHTHTCVHTYTWTYIHAYTHTHARAHARNITDKRGCAESKIIPFSEEQISQNEAQANVAVTFRFQCNNLKVISLIRGKQFHTGENFSKLIVHATGYNQYLIYTSIVQWL